MAKPVEGMVIPHDVVAEQAVIGAIALDPDVYDSVSQIIKPESFYSHTNAVIYKVIRDLCEEGHRGVDVINVSHELKKRGLYEDCGGAAYLNEVLAAVPHAAHAEYYAKIVREKFILRQLMLVSEKIYSEAGAENQGAADVEQMLAGAEKLILGIMDGLESVEQKTFSEVLDEAFQAIFARMERDGEVGTPTGIPELDKMTSGFVPTEVIVLAARPGMGKTALICNLSVSVASEDKPVLLFCLEQSRQEISERFLTIRSQVNGHRLRRGEIDSEEEQKLMSAATEMRALKLIIDDKPGRTMPQISAIARRQNRMQPLGLIVIDYLQLIEAEDQKQFREQHIAATTRRLKCLAKELHVPILVLSQLNRGLEGREDKRPKLSDLRESGAIEQDADIVMFLHRPEVFDPEDRPGEADLIVSKNRHGPPGTVSLIWDRERMTFKSKTESLPIELF